MALSTHCAMATAGPQVLARNLSWPTRLAADDEAPEAGQGDLSRKGEDQKHADHQKGA